MVTQRCFDEIYCPANIFLFKVSNRNIGKRCEICSKLRINTSEQSRWQRSVFIVNFEHISHLIWVLLLLTLNRYTVWDCLLGRASGVHFWQISVGRSPCRRKIFQEKVNFLWIIILKFECYSCSRHSEFSHKCLKMLFLNITLSQISNKF